MLKTTYFDLALKLLWKFLIEAHISGMYFPYIQTSMSPETEFDPS